MYIIKVEHMTKFSWETVLYSVKKTPATLPPTSPLKVQQVYIKSSINNNGISQQNPRQNNKLYFKQTARYTNYFKRNMFLVNNYDAKTTASR